MAIHEKHKLYLIGLEKKSKASGTVRRLDLIQEGHFDLWIYESESLSVAKTLQRDFTTLLSLYPSSPWLQSRMRAFIFLKSSKNLSKQIMIGMKLQSLFRRKEKLTNHIVINVEAHQGLAICRQCPHGHADCCCQSEVGGRFAPKRKTAHSEYLDCAVQIFGALRHGCHHPELARQSLPVIDLIISNYPTVFLCMLCSSGQGRRTGGI